MEFMGIEEMRIIEVLWRKRSRERRSCTLVAVASGCALGDASASARPFTAAVGVAVCAVVARLLNFAKGTFAVLELTNEIPQFGDCAFRNHV